MIEDSPLIPKLWDCLDFAPSQSAKHYILATTSSCVEWCEIVAESHAIEIDEPET